MEQLQARILIKHVEGAVIAYFYNREDFTLLDVKRDDYSQSQFIEIGNIITLNEMKYEVKSINFKMEAELHDMGHGKGINLYSPSDPSDFNCQIGIFVDNA